MIANIFAVGGIVLLGVFWWILFTLFPDGAPIELSMKVVAYSLLGGVVPALLWLWFWLKEDKRHPEPKTLILLSFLAGMVAIPFTIPLERAADILVRDMTFLSFYSMEVVIFVLWAFIEEFFKFIAVYFVAFRSRFFDEPIDALVYVITAALGFAALENSLYLMTAIVEDGVLEGALNSHLRFIGATLLHVVSSSAIGVMIAFSFYRKKRRSIYVPLGVVLATILHALFNLFIIRAQDILETITIFGYYWMFIAVLIALFEKIKRLRRPLIISTNTDSYVRKG